MNKNDQLSGYHVKVVLWFLTGFFTFLIGLITYIWQDSKDDNLMLIETLQKNLNELKSTVEDHDAEIAEIKKYILLQGYDVDDKIQQKDWKKLHKKTKSNPRGQEKSYNELKTKTTDFAGE